MLMSGGVDSSITAYLLKKQGWDVLGITMKIPTACNTGKSGCCGADAAFVCSDLDIPHYFVDVIEPFEELIIKPFRESYSNGRTPNPCADCNTFLKFSLLWDFLQQTFGITYLATGHYAKVLKSDDGIFLARAEDKTKDQSYFLYGIVPDRLVNLVLPLGQWYKAEVCLLAAKLNLSVADKPESMDLCFAGEGNYRDVLVEQQASQSGDITDMQGSKIGIHRGIANYTLGQRKGVGIAGGKPLYVANINPKANIIAIGTREEISSNIIRAEKTNVFVPDQLVAGGEFFGKIRSYGDPHSCRLISVDDAEITIRFDQPQFAPCPGQKLVLYNNDDHLVAGGTISGTDNKMYY